MRARAAERDDRFTFFCRRLGERPEGQFGARWLERNLVQRLHRTKQDTCADQS